LAENYERCNNIKTCPYTVEHSSAAKLLVDGWATQADNAKLLVDVWATLAVCRMAEFFHFF
jgi:hypothetical protein